MENTRLEFLRKEEAELREKLSANVGEQQHINCQAWLDERGLKIGDTVSYEDGSKTVTGILDKVTPMQTEFGYAWVKPFKKDGKTGEKLNRLYSWNCRTIKKIAPSAEKEYQP